MGRVSDNSKNPVIGFFCFAVALILMTGSATAAGSVRVDKVSEQMTDSNLTYNITYPHISGICNESMQQRLNVAFKERAQIIHTKAKYESRSGTVNADMSFDVKRNQDGVMSLVLKEKINSVKGERLDMTGVTVDTVTGQRYRLCDIFIDNADFSKVLTDLVMARESKNGQEPSFYKISGHEDFYLTTDSLVLLIRQGDFCTDKCSVQEFTIPLKDIDKMLKPQFSVVK